MDFDLAAALAVLERTPRALADRGGLISPFSIGEDEELP